MLVTLCVYMWGGARRKGGGGRRELYMSKSVGAEAGRSEEAAGAGCWLSSSPPLYLPARTLSFSLGWLTSKTWKCMLSTAGGPSIHSPLDF